MRALVPELVVGALERRATIVTANERAARGARRTWDDLQRSRGLVSWETARALSWRSWLTSLWHTLQLAGLSDLMLLSAAQEHQIWRAIVQPDGRALSARRLDALASTCAEGYGRLCDFGAEDRLQQMHGRLRGDPAAFAGWVRRFEQRCRRERMLSISTLPAAVTQLIGPEVVPEPEREIVLLGFDELLPVQQELVATWRSRVGAVSMLAPSEPSVITLVRAPDPQAELRGVARWAHERLTEDSQSRIGLVVADLEGERDDIESVLREMLAPELADIQADASTAPFEFSLGRSLASESLIHGALDMLDWLAGPLSLERIERLLLGPSISGHHQERAARGHFASLLARKIRLRPEATVEQVLRILNQEPGDTLPALTRALRGLGRCASMTDVVNQQSFAGWVSEISAALEAALWARELSSRSYQLVERWNSVLDTLASLDFDGAVVTWTEALATLKHLARETIFAPERREAPVQVLGPREAAGSQFDFLWVLGSGELQWPPEQGSHPLLPHTLERALGLPGGDREVTQRSGLLLTKRLAASATEVFFSYAERTADGTVVRPAAEVLAMHHTPRTMEQVVPLEETHEVVTLERLPDTGRIAPLRDSSVSGGVRVLELQAQCGFLAFSELRLHAKQLASASFGLSAGERGNAVHRALETLWDQLRSQEALLELPEPERWAVLDAAITAGLQRSGEGADDAWARSYLNVQRDRMRRLLRAWLGHEMTRPAFVVSQQEEKVHALQVGPLRLSVRVDRIDLVDGARVLLDYKTGAADTKHWKGERPDRPQVPLYAVLASAPTQVPDETNQPVSAPLGAVAYAKVVAGKEMGLQGFEREQSSLLPDPGRRKMEEASFEEQVQRWSEIVARLATEFAEGDARVRPKQFPGSCLRCGHRILCRVDAADFDDASTEDDEEDAEHDG